MASVPFRHFSSPTSSTSSKIAQGLEQWLVGVVLVVLPGLIWHGRDHPVVWSRLSSDGPIKPRAWVCKCAHCGHRTAEEFDFQALKNDVSLSLLPTSSQPSAPVESSSGWDGGLKLKYLFMRRSANISPPLWKIFSQNICAPPSLHYPGLAVCGWRAARASRVLNVLAGKRGWRWRHAARCSVMERFVTKRSSSITMATCYSEDARTALKHSRVLGRLLSVSL